MFRQKSFAYPVTTSVAFHVNHWVNLLWANQVGIIVRWVEQITGHPLWTAWKLLKTLLIWLFSGLGQLFKLESLSAAFGRGALRTAAMRAFNKIGRNCEIHPSAILHFCIIGDNVKIGPQSYVFGSVLGDGVYVEEKTKIVFTSLGANCFVSQITILNGVAAYPDGDVCIDGAHFCLAGRNVKLTGLARPLDLRTDGPIKVLHKGKAVEIGQEVLGSCFGHRCFLGPDIYIMPGREIPNDAVIIQPPGRVLQKIPGDFKPGVPMVVDGGTLRPYDPEKDNR
jgi:acetyltransferase-like isoleucine patch superfamily enzyme